MNERPKTDETKCFLCQETEPRILATRNGEQFKLCIQCAALVKRENELQNRIRESLHRNDRLRIFQYTLGMSPLPTTITMEPIS